MQVTRKSDGLVISQQLRVAEKMLERMVGLMFRAEMNGFDALLIKECRSIHTFFMRYPIDVVFLNASFEVRKIIRNIKPWRMTWIYFSASQVLELRAGALPIEVREGDKLEVVCTS
jgi:uncharacterized protein